MFLRSGKTEKDYSDSDSDVYVSSSDDDYNDIPSSNEKNVCNESEIL